MSHDTKTERAGTLKEIKTALSSIKYVDGRCICFGLICNIECNYCDWTGNCSRDLNGTGYPLVVPLVRLPKRRWLDVSNEKHSDELYKKLLEMHQL